MSQLLLPVTNPANNTINQMSGADCVYEAIRYQFISTGSREYNERDIVKTIKLYLQSGLCTDPVIGYDGTEFHMVGADTDTPFQKVKRIYGLQDEFIARCVDPMQLNMLAVADQSTDPIVKNSLYRLSSTLTELKTKYLFHDECLKIIEVLKYLL